MDKPSEFEMANSEENSEVLFQNDTYHCEQIMPHGTAVSNIIFNEIQVDGDRELENIVSRVPDHDVFQYGAVTSQLLNELDPTDKSLDQFETKFDEESSFNTSYEGNMLLETQASTLDVSNDNWDIYSTNNEIQNRSDVQDIDEYNIPNTNILHNSIYVPNIEQPSSSYVSNSNLNPSIQPSYSDNKPFPCKTCNKEYETKCGLKNHLETHMRKKQFLCSVCNKQLAKKEYVKHMLDHCKEKPFLCRVCSKKFATKYSLEKHMLTHTGEEPFSCSTCNKRFVQKHHLDDHIRTHTREKPYICNVCHKGFNRNSSLNRHMLTCAK